MSDFGCEELQVEETFVMVKPEGLKRHLVGEIIRRFENCGLQLQALKLVHPTLDQLMDHYSEHRERPYFKSMMDYLITAGPVIPMVLRGPGAVAVARKLIGVTDPNASACATLRGSFAISVKRTAIHGADSRESAAREIKIWFSADEIVKVDHHQS